MRSACAVGRGSARPQVSAGARGVERAPPPRGARPRPRRPPERPPRPGPALGERAAPAALPVQGISAGRGRCPPPGAGGRVGVSRRLGSQGYWGAKLTRWAGGAGGTSLGVRLCYGRSHGPVRLGCAVPEPLAARLVLPEARPPTGTWG